MKCKRLTLFTLITILFFIPFYVNAKESCTIVSGNGTDIGSEIACGEEHFYVIDSNDTSVRMLAKYNLGVGDTYNKITLSQERWDELFSKYGYNDYGQPWFYRAVLAEPEFDGEYAFAYDVSKTFDEDNLAIYTHKEMNDEYKTIVVSEERYNELKAQYSIDDNGNIGNYDINNEPEFGEWWPLYANPEYHAFGVVRDLDRPVKQDATAVGAHGGTSGNPEYPEVGVVKSQSSLGLYFYDESLTEDYRGGYNDIIIDTNKFNTDEYYLKYLKQYKTNLNNYEIEDYSFLTISDLDNIVYKLTGNHLPLEDWLTGWQSTINPLFGEYSIMGNFKQYLPNGYEWLYSTTYWTRSGIGNDTNARFEIFIDTLGNVCNDDFCSIAVGAGARPVLTIPKIEVPTYTITKDTDTNGTIEATTESASGEEVSFTLKAKAGYKLKTVTVKDANNQTVTVTDVSSTTENGQLVYTKKFTMPSSNVTITATWEEIVYDIDKDTNDNGQIEVIPESASGEEVLFVLRAKSGFKLKTIAILNENNEVVDYAELTETLEEGIYVYRSKFVMPSAGVTIKAVWEEIEEPATPDEPETEYEIKSNITGDGKIEVVSKAKKGDEVTFKLTALNGTTITKLVVKDSDGNTIKYTSVSEDKDGNTIISINKFTMPEKNITIEATFEVVKVPITGDSINIYIMILIASLIILSIARSTYKKNNKKKVLVIE